MRSLALLALSLSTLLAASEPAAVAPASSDLIGIGAGEEKPTHLSFDIEKGARIVKVSTRLIVDQVAPQGLNFFAIQVNFPNKTWAHGGPQINGKAGELVQYANWGGLVNRGGGSKDYTEADPKRDFYLIECGIEKPNTVPWKWKQGVEYILTVERDRQVELPAGNYGPKRNIALEKRTMWAWKFTIVPAKPTEGVESFSSIIYDTADSIQWFCVWNESGYGSQSHEQHARWSKPIYWVDGDPKEKATTKFFRH